MILLSDGIGRWVYDPDAIIAGPVARAKALGVRIYTIGFGDPSALDEPLLRRIASASGGSAPTPRPSRTTSTTSSSTPRCSHGQGRGAVQRDRGQGRRSPWGASLSRRASTSRPCSNWPGSKLRLTLTDPNGVRVDWLPRVPDFRFSPRSGGRRAGQAGSLEGLGLRQKVSQPKEPYYSIVVDKVAAAPPLAVPSATPSPTPSATPKPKPKSSKKPTKQPSTFALSF